MGMTEDSPHQLRIPPDHFCHNTIRDALVEIIELFHDAVSTERSIRLQENPTTSSYTIYWQYHSSPAEENDLTRLLLKARWIANDRKKFGVFVQEIRVLINGLRDLTQDIASPVAPREHRTRGNCEREHSG